MHLSYPSQEDSCIYVFRTMENTMWGCHSGAYE
jgi:hypothetical protein